MSLFPENIKHVALVAPAGRVSAEQVAAGRKLLENADLKVTVMAQAFSSPAELPWLAGTVRNRVDDLHRCWQDDSIDLVMAIRGGSGAAQLLPYLDWELLRSRSLPFIGYSDISALHLAMLKFGVSMPIVAPMSGKLAEALAGEGAQMTRRYLYQALLPSPPAEILAEDLTVLKTGSVCGRVIVSNLTVLCSLCGTPYLPDFNETILLLEDINEPPYRLERCLTQLQLCAVLKQCRGVIFGSFTSCGSDAEIAAIQQKYADCINGPVVAGFPFGHTFPMVSLRNGSAIQIDNNGRVTALAEI